MQKAEKKSMICSFTKGGDGCFKIKFNNRAIEETLMHFYRSIFLRIDNYCDLFGGGSF